MKAVHQYSELDTKETRIGILGGMGTLTGGDFVNELTVLFTKYFKTEHEHPSIVMYSNSHMPRRDKSIESGDDKELVEYLKKAMDFFVANDATFIAAPCNTLMYYKDYLESYIKSRGKDIPILNIVQITANATDKLLPDIQKIGLISTKATAQQGLYDQAFSSCSRKVIREVIKLDEKHQTLAIEVLEGIKKGEHKHPQKKPILLTKIGHCIQYLESKGAKAIVLGCTEFPLLINNKNNTKGQVPLISSTQCLTEACIEHALMLEKEQLFKRLGIKQNQNGNFHSKL